MATVKKIIAILFLVINIYATFTGFKEGFIKTEIISERVLITNKYEIEHRNKGGTTSSHYMTGQNENGYHKIIGSSYNIGDYATVYQNPESTNAKSSDPEKEESIFFKKNPLMGLIIVLSIR